MGGDNSLNGIHFMLPTPFSEDGRLDVKPFARLLGAAQVAGCRGVVCLGVMGEAHRLTDAERSQVLESVVAVSGNLTVTVGISADSEQVVAERSHEAERAGATAVMASPARMAKPNPESTFSYYAQIQESTAIPIVVQDLPEQTGVHMDPAFIARLNRELPGAKYLKLEDPPTPPKITRVLALTGDRMGIFGGMGGGFLLEELQRGAVGTMTGFAYPEVLAAIHRRHAAGDVDGARSIFYRWLPLIRYENQQGIGLSIRKHILAKRGFLDVPAVRRPAPALDEATRTELDDVLGALDLDVSNL